MYKQCSVVLQEGVSVYKQCYVVLQEGVSVCISNVLWCCRRESVCV